jgi:hypothetical protein
LFSRNTFIKKNLKNYSSKVMRTATACRSVLRLT